MCYIGNIICLESTPLVYNSDTCDFNIWDRAVATRLIPLTCSEGKIIWRPPSGNLNLTINPLMDNDEIVEACFAVTFYKIKFKVFAFTASGSKQILFSNEKLKNIKKRSMRTFCYVMNQTPDYVFVETYPNQSKSSSKLRSSIMIEYDLYVKKEPLYYDYLEECEPCTHSELLKSVCTQDIALRGKMMDVTVLNTSSESVIMIKANNIIRQTSDIFRPAEDIVSKKMSTELYIGSIYAPSKCHIKYGIGEFLFLARMRLGKALFLCAPRWENFLSLWKKYKDIGESPCSLDEIMEF